MARVSRMAPLSRDTDVRPALAAASPAVICPSSDIFATSIAVRLRADAGNGTKKPSFAGGHLWAGAGLFKTASSATFPQERGVEHGRQERVEARRDGGDGPDDARPTRLRRRAG